jgi:hypothetical protein
MTGRPERPLTKLQTPELFLPDGTKVKVELLAEGQQFVADGIHPDTGKPYTWTNGSPAEVAIGELPVVTEEQARGVITEAERLLRAAGAREKEKPRQERHHGPNGTGGGFFAQVNAGALKDIAAWARTLFPRARFEPGTGAWRVSSKDLGRDLEEDISIHPDGIRDFGKEEPLSPVDLVMRHAGTATPAEAALWLCERLRMDPATLGYTGKRKPTESNEDNDQLLCERPDLRRIADIPPRQWAYGNFLLFGSTSVVGAVDGGGKGAQAVVIALSMITGRALLGEHVWRKGPVAIITYEDDKAEWCRRIAAACLHYEIDYETVITGFHFLRRPNSRVRLAAKSPVTGNTIFPDGDDIIARLIEIGAVLLIIDPFNHAHALEDGNNNALIAQVAGEAARIAAESQAALLVLHHLRKGATGAPDDLMGALVLRATFRACRILARMTAEQAEKLKIPSREAWRYCRIAGTKENYAPPPELATWYRLESVDLGNPAGIYTRGDNVQAMTAWTPVSPFKDLPITAIADIFDAVRSSQKENRWLSPDARSNNWIGKIITTITGKSDDDATIIIKEWMENEVLKKDKVKDPKRRHEVNCLILNEAKAAEIVPNHLFRQSLENDDQ